MLQIVSWADGGMLLQMASAGCGKERQLIKRLVGRLDLAIGLELHTLWQG